MTSSSEGPVDRVTVSLVGSTGSIGTQSIEVIEQCPDRFDVVAIGAHRSVDLLAAQGRLAGTATGELMTYALPGPAAG